MQVSIHIYEQYNNLKLNTTAGTVENCISLVFSHLTAVSFFIKFKFVELLLVNSFTSWKQCERQQNSHGN